MNIAQSQQKSPQSWQLYLLLAVYFHWMPCAYPFKAAKFDALRRLLIHSLILPTFRYSDIIIHGSFRSYWFGQVLSTCSKIKSKILAVSICSWSLELNTQQIWNPFHNSPIFLYILAVFVVLFCSSKFSQELQSHLRILWPFAVTWDDYT